MSRLYALISAQRYREAHSEAIARLGANGRDAEAVTALGLIAFEHGNHAKGFELLERACALAPTDAAPAAHLARALSLAGRQKAARTWAEEAAARASRTDGTPAYIRDMIGVVLARVGLHARAVPLFDAAIAQDAEPANTHYNLAASLQFLGRFTEAETAYRAVLQRDPDHYRAMSSLAALRKQTGDDNRLPELEAAFGRLSADPDAALHIGHAIAKTLEDLDRPADSLLWLGRAKAPKRAAIGYDVERDVALFEAAARTHPASATDIAVADASPLFVTGLPRTGTTLVERILSSHPDVASVGELNAFADAAKRLSGTASRYVLDPETLDTLAARDVGPLGPDYTVFVAELLASLGAAGRRSVDKMPLNILNAGLIHRALPEARIVCLRRGAMDSCLSNYRQLFSTGHSYYNYGFDLLDTARYYRAFDALVAHWRAHIPDDRFMEIRYEDIVSDQEAQTRRLLAFCGLSWDERCLRFHENDAPVSTASSVQVRQPLYSGSIGRWRRYGAALDPLKEALGALADAGEGA